MLTVVVRLSFKNKNKKVPKDYQIDTLHATYKPD